MRHFWKRLIAGALVTVMVITMLPATAYAAVGDLVRRDAVENAALLQALREVYGDDAEAYLAVLEQYGLIDEDGNFVTDEKIVMDGVEYTLDEIEAILDDPATDLSKVVEVDGTYLTLEELKTIVEIERYLAYIKATYFTEQDLTDEQIASFYDLAQAWASGEVMMLAANGFEGVGPAGVDHGVTLTVEAADTISYATTSYTITVTASKSDANAGQDISFDWEVLSVSGAVTGGGHVAMRDNTSETLTVTKPEKWETFLVRIYNVKNALIEGETHWQKVIEAPVFSSTTSRQMTQTVQITQYGETTYWCPRSYKVSEGTVASSLPTWYENGNFLWRTQTVNSTGVFLSSGTYSGTATFNLRLYAWNVSEYEHANLFWPDVNNWYPQKPDATIAGDPGKLQLITTINDGEEITVTVPLRDFAYRAQLQNCVVEVPIEMTLESSGAVRFSPKVLQSVSHYYRLDANGVTTDCDFYFLPDIGTGDGVTSGGSVTLKLQESTRSTEVSFAAPAGTYSAGEIVPITATFDYPMKIATDMTITVNGTTLKPMRTGYSSECTYLYTVDKTSGASLTITDTSFVGDEKADVALGSNGLGMTVNVKQDSPIQIGTEAAGVKLESLIRTDAFAGYQADVSINPETKRPQLTVTVPLSENEKETMWVLNEVNGDNTLEALQVMTSQTGKDTFAFQLNEGNTALTATITLPYNTSTREIQGRVDFLLDGAVMMGKGLTYTVPKSIPVTAEALHPFLTVTPAGGSGKSYQPGDTVPLLYAQQGDALALSFTLDGRTDYTWGNTTKVTYITKNGYPADYSAHFAWRSSDLTVASVTVDSEGKAVLAPTGKEGTVTLTLVALNSTMADAESGGITVSFAVGQDPFLLIPELGTSVSIREGQDATVSWTSNICAKTAADAERAGVDFIPTTFHVRMLAGGAEVALPEDIAQLTTTEENGIISSVTIPWNTVLKGLYDSGARGASVEVWAEYGDAKYGTYYDAGTGQYLSKTATATISMISQPATVKLGVLNLYQTDGGKDKDITLTWTVPNLDTTTEGRGQFELYIASDALPDGQPISVTTVGDARGVTKTGDVYSYTLHVPKVELGDDPASYRDSYAITVKAKNSAETTWAYDSYVLYVYSDSALRLLLDGAQAEETHLMSNVEMIAGKWGAGGKDGSDAIVALRRDIALKNVISINYGQYAWAELADQIAWNSTESGVASVNYQQGTLYENIENFSYTSYRPSTDFILSGLEDGETTITATHVRTGIKDTVTVNVKTLRDQLYLFQCYPKVTTTLTYQVYTDASRTATAEYALETTETGEAAIYAPHGIAGDIYCKSETTENNEPVTYVGTIYNRSLVSSETDSTKLQLYPVNTLQLRRAAQAEIYLKNPDGTPYEGKVTFRGGVYRQGEYCPGTTESPLTFGLQGAPRADWKTGDVAQTVETGADGRLLVTMDLMQFKTGDDQKDVQAGEKLYYVFQLDYDDGESAESVKYYPLLLRVDASLNLADIAASGDSIVAWEANDSGKRQPYIAQQTLKYSMSASANVVDIRRNTGKVGPSNTFPTAYITTTVMWWGDEDAAEEGRVNSVLLQDTTGKTPACQTSKTTTYPFTELVFTENVMTLNDSAMRAWGVSAGGGRSMRAVLSEDGTTASRTMNLPFKIVNMIGVVKAEDDNVLPDALRDAKNSVDVDVSDKLSTENKLLQAGMKLVSKDAKYNPDKNKDTFGVFLYATSDPTVFRALFCVSAGNMGSGGNVTGVYPQYSDQENMTFVDVNSSTGMENTDSSILPTPMNIYNMARGNYLDKVNQEYSDAASGKGVRSFNMDLGGYMEADIVYNTDTQSWECRPISGGFHVGGGLNYSWNYNTVVGVVPVTVSLTMGGSLEVRVDMQQGHYILANNSNGALQDAVAAKDEKKFNEVLSSATWHEAVGTDYLTTLRLYLYARVFAGVGFDYSVVAFKIGVFGQLNVDFQVKWLNRSYLGSQGYSMAGPIDTWTKENMAADRLGLSGSTGIEFFFKFLFISYEKVLCSAGFELGGGFSGNWNTIEEIWKANQTINNQQVTRMAMPNGQVMYAVDLGAQLESRDYVDVADQVWVGGQPGISLFSLDNRNTTLAKALQEGAYSYANPVLSDDGAIMFYLSDRGDAPYNDAKDVTNTRAAVSVRSGAQYQEGKRFDDTMSGDVAVGFGDSNVKVAGSSEGGYAAVWVRQMENFALTSGDGGTLDEGQQMLQMNSTEIIAATSEDGQSWTLTRLTDNDTPDLAPVVATNGTRTVVAWREVNSSSADALTSFDQQDAIRFAVYENGKWSKTQTLYDAAAGASVKGIEAAMLKNGAAAVVYTLDTGADPDGNTDWETVVAIIPAETGSRDGDAGYEDAVRTFRLTSDSSLDENPQITTANFADHQERFVVAWHTERPVADSGETESDIRLAAMDASGVLYENMPESLGRATDGTGDTIDANFRFAKNAGSIDNLAILWVDTVNTSADEKTYADLEAAISASSVRVGYDVLKAVKFVEAGNSFTVSGAVEVAKMEGRNLIDHFDAYMSGGEIKSVILGTYYGLPTERQVTISNGNPEEDYTATIQVANPTSKMYTATAQFTNQIQEAAVMLEYDKLYPNSAIDVQFTIRNTGKDAVTGLSITSPDGNETYYTTANDPLYNGEIGKLNLLPNRDITVTARFETGEAIANAKYIIRATVDGQEEPVALSSTLYLDIPDVGISQVETVREADGERTLRYSLYNALSAKLADEKDYWRVHVGFYADQNCTEPLKDEKGNDLVKTIDQKSDLALIDAGGYSAEVTIPVGSYVAEGEEIPDGGIQVYVKAWVEGWNRYYQYLKYDTVYEYYQSNNTTSRTLENLALRRNEDVTLQSTLDNSGDASVVTVNVQYNHLNGTTTGNLIVTLLDANGQPLEKLQSYSLDGDQLLTLTKEGTETQTFTFSQKGAEVLVEFSNLVLNENSVELDHVSLSGAEVTYDPDAKTYTASGAGLTSGILGIAPKDPGAEITFNSKPYDATQATTLPLSYGTTQWKIVVTNGSETETYTLVLNNTDPRPSSGGSAIYSVEVPEAADHGTVTVSQKQARSGQTVTITAKPDAGYQVG